MAIIRTTETIDLAIPETGTPNWGDILNQNSDKIDQAFSDDRERLDYLEIEAGLLPLALASKVGHNVLLNNIFSRGNVSDPAKAVHWTTVFANGAIGNVTRDSSTFVIGRGGSSNAVSQRITILNVNLANQVQPFPNMNIKDPETQIALAANDERQLLKSFGCVFQAVEISPNTKYTLSGFGKADIPTVVPPISVHWKLGVVFKDQNQNIIHSYFTTPQRNFTSNKGTDSFRRVELTFTSPNLPVVNCEIWLVNESESSGGLGSVYFDGVQLEQSTRATSLETLAIRNGDVFLDGSLYVGGNLILQQEQLTLDVGSFVLSGNVQLGDDITTDLLDIYTKLSTFYGDVEIRGNTKIGDQTNSDLLEVRTLKTTFLDNQDSLNPVGGDVEIQGDLVVKQSTILGDDITRDSLTVNAETQINQDTHIDGDVDISGFLHVDRDVILGTNNILDKFTVRMQTLGSEFTGDVLLNDKLTVVDDVSFNSNLYLSGSQTIGQDLELTGSLYVGGPVNLDIGTTSGDNLDILVKNITVNGSTGTTVWNSSNFDLSGSLEVGSGSNLQTFHALVGDIILGDPSLSSTTAISLNATLCSLTGNMDIDQDLSASGDLVIGAKTSGLVALGTEIVTGRTLVSFNGQSIIPSTGPQSGLEQIQSTIALGDPNAIILDGTGRQVFNSQISINGGKVYIGSAGSGSGGDEVCGDVIIGGNLTVGGKTVLGNQKVSDTLDIKAYRANLDIGNGSFNIAGGFVGATYNPSITDHGGVTFDQNGNVLIDGKLTVKGPIDPIRLELAPISTHANQLALDIKKDGITQTLSIDRDGNYQSTGESIFGNYSFLNSSTILGTNSSLTVFSINSAQTNISGNLDVDQNATLGSIISEDTLVVQGEVSFNQSLIVAKNITAQGTSFIFGDTVATQGPTQTNCNILVDKINLGLDGLRIGDVVIANDLDVRASTRVGTDVEVDTHHLKGHTITLEVASRRQTLPFGEQLELAGVRIGGGINGPGYQNRIYDENELDHGGVTIDAYGNIFADGIITSRGPLAFDTLTLNTPNQTLDGNVSFNILNMNLGLGDEVFRVDNLGGVRADGYLALYDEHTLYAPDSYIDSQNISGILTPVPITDGYAILTINNSNLSERVFEVDNFGNQVSKGLIINKYPGGSNLTVASVTVGDGIETHGDFNLSGPHNASSNPIQAAINYLSSMTNPNGKIFIKRGTYPLLTGGLILYNNMTLQGEGGGTILNGTDLGINTASNNIITNLTLIGFQTGIKIAGGNLNCKINDNYLSNCEIGIDCEGSRNIFTNNHITGDGSTSISGIDLDGNENCVTSNYISDYTAAGIRSSGSDNVIVANVTMRN